MMNISWWVHILLKCKWFLPRISSYTADRENFLGEERTCSSFILLNRSSPDMLPFFHSQTMGPEAMTSYELSGVCIYDRNHLTCSKFDFLQSYSYFDRHFFSPLQWIGFSCVLCFLQFVISMHAQRHVGIIAWFSWNVWKHFLCLLAWWIITDRARKKCQWSSLQWETSAILSTCVHASCCVV